MHTINNIQTRGHGVNKGMSESEYIVPAFTKTITVSEAVEVANQNI